MKRLNNQSGQVMLEYILVVMITVAIIIGVVYQFNDAFKSYAENYFGNYLACLLETGELMSAQGNPGANGQSCAATYKPFSLSDGKSLAQNASGSSGKSGSSSSSSSLSQTSRPTKSENESSSASNIPVRSSSASQSSGSRGSNQGSVDDDFSKKNARYTGSSGSSIPGSALNSKGGNAGANNRYLEGEFYVDRRGKDSEERTTNLVKVSSPTGTKVGDRMLVRKKGISKDLAIQDGEEWSFGTYLRFLIIAAIVITLLLLIGGQTLQITKGMDS